MKGWLENDAVLQVGELTGWPKLLEGDDFVLHWMQEAKNLVKSGRSFSRRLRSYADENEVIWGGC